MAVPEPEAKSSNSKRFALRGSTASRTCKLGSRITRPAERAQGMNVQIFVICISANKLICYIVVYCKFQNKVLHIGIDTQTR